MAREPGCLAGIRCARRRSPPPRFGVEKKKHPARCAEGKEKEEDEVGDRGSEQNKDRRLGRAPWPGEGARQTPDLTTSRGRPGCWVSLRSTQPTASRHGGALFAGLFDIVNLKTAI